MTPRISLVEFMIAFCLAAILCMLGGCGMYDLPPNGAGPAVTFLYVEPGAELTEADALAGCEMWAPVGVECAVAKGPDWAITVTTFNDGSNGALWGQYDGARTIKVNVAEPEWVRSTIAHELGHSFGLPESPDWRDLMGQGPALTAADIDAFRSVRP